MSGQGPIRWCSGGWHSDGTQMALRWHSDSTQMALRWRSDGTQMALRWHSDGTQLANSQLKDERRDILWPIGLGHAPEDRDEARRARRIASNGTAVDADAQLAAKLDALGDL